MLPTLLLAIVVALVAWSITARGSTGVAHRAFVLEPNAEAPDLAEQVPSQLKVMTIAVAHQKFFVLAFQTVAENLSTNYRGQVFIVGHRSSTKVPVMTADQYINIQDNSGHVIAQQVVPNVGTLIYQKVLVGHDHWHFQNFETYTLVRASDGSVVSTDRKVGFCLTSDVKVHDPGLPPAQDVPNDVTHTTQRIVTRADLLSGCGKRKPKLLRIVEALDAGTGDVYERFLGGQNVDITNAPNGRYVLVVRVNPDDKLVETNYANDFASVLVSIDRSQRGAAPTVRVLKRCPGSQTCSTP